jgi:hypothetical protein
MKLRLILLTTIFNMAVFAQQKNYHFSYSLSTQASQDEIWKIWTDVPNWKTWDTGLKDAKLEGIFRNGANGKLTPDQGKISDFIIEKVIENSTYTLKVRIPFGWLKVHRYMVLENDIVVFTHDVQFAGVMKGLIGKKIGKRYREMLPIVMQNIKVIAEAEN